MLANWRRCVSTLNRAVVTKQHGTKVVENGPNTLQRRYVLQQQCRCYATGREEEVVDSKGNVVTNPFFSDEIRKYNMGKRWLAKMMGEDPDNFSQEDMDEAIEYLLPSHLFAKDARPKLKHPYTVFPLIPADKIDSSGRPIDSGFYTMKPKYHDLIYEIWGVMEELGITRSLPDYSAAKPLHVPEDITIESEDSPADHSADDTSRGDSLLSEAPADDEYDELLTGLSDLKTLNEDGDSPIQSSIEDSIQSSNEGSIKSSNEGSIKSSKAVSKKAERTEWLTKWELSELIHESMSEKDYNTIVFRLNRLANHERADEISEFLFRFRKPITAAQADPLRDVTVYENYVRAMGYRKRAIAEIFLREGSGTITVNNFSLYDYFQNMYHREQIMYPLLIVGELDRFDIECHLIDGGFSGQAGAIRLAISRALAAWSPEHYEALDEENLLIRDWRVKERKKPGRKKARRAFQWVKR